MSELNLSLLHRAEQKIGVASPGTAQQFKRFGNTWIRCNRSSEEIKQGILHSEIPYYFKLSFKRWFFYFVKFPKRSKNKNKESLKKLIGVNFLWRFLKEEELTIQADFIYQRRDSLVLIYSIHDQKQVLKIGVTPWGKTVLRREVSAQKQALKIKNREVFIPTILFEYDENDLCLVVESFFTGKRGSFTKKQDLNNRYEKVFQFLVKFYLDNPIELRYLYEDKYLNREEVEQLIGREKYGQKVINQYRKLESRRKKMILCLIHGDLNHNNVLASRDKVGLIDWGQSKMNYLAREMDNSSYDTSSVFEEFVIKAAIDPKEIYNYNEQIFLYRYAETNRLISKAIRNKSYEKRRYLFKKMIEKSYLQSKNLNK